MPGTVTAHGLVLDALGERPRLQELTVEPPGPGEVRVRMRAAGLCHTDVSQVRDARFTPILLGHEGAGEVESVGPGVEDLSAGDPVLVCWKVPCGRCRRCLRDEAHLCEAVVGLAEPRVFRGGEPVGAMLNAGCFCDLVVLPTAGAVPIHADVPFEEAALVGCAVVTGVGAALWTAGVAGGDSVAVFGAGGVGLNVVVGARLAGADTIVAVYPDPHRRDLALARGATEAIAPGEPFEPVDFAFEVVGEPAVMERAVESLAPGGELVLVGAAARDATMSFHPRAFLSRQQRITGCIYGSASPAEHLPQLLAWAADGTIPLADLIGRRVSLGELEDAFDQPANGGVRTVVTYRLEELDPSGLEARLAEKPALVLALGTIEWHSHHLPLGLDLLKAQAIAERTAARAEAVLAPASWWAAGGVPQPYTLRLSGSVTEPVLAAVFDGFAGMGFRAICLLNGHYGLENSIAVRRAALACAEATVIPLADYELLTDLGATGDHAGVFEAALLLPDRPDLVHLEIRGDLPGVIGDDPRGRATPGLGEQALELASSRAAALLDRALVEPREPIAEALAAAVKALEVLWRLREDLPREHVPPVTTSAWIRHLERFRDGDWSGARDAATAKAADPAS